MFPARDDPRQPLEELIPPEHLAANLPELPELSEPDVIRHFVNLSTLNMSVDTHFYPLGSCTMKYNPKRHERLAGLPGLVDLHPYQPERDVQGMLQILHELQQMLGEIAGSEELRELRMAELFNRLVEKGKTIEVIYSQGQWFDVDEISDVMAAGAERSMR